MTDEIREQIAQIRQAQRAVATQLSDEWAEDYGRWADTMEKLLAAVSARDDLLNECINELEQIARGKHVTGDKIDRALYASGFASKLCQSVATLDQMSVKEER